MRLLFNIDEVSVFSVSISDFISIIDKCLKNDMQKNVDFTDDLESPLLYHYLGREIDDSQMDIADYMMTRQSFRMMDYTQHKVNLPLFKNVNPGCKVIRDGDLVMYGCEQVVIWHEDFLQMTFYLDNDYKNTYIQPGSYHPKPYPDTFKNPNDILIKVKFIDTLISNDNTYIDFEWSFEQFDQNTFKQLFIFKYFLRVDKYYVDNFESVYKLCIKKHLSGNE